ncbi:hypothetical protein K438DRAFT_2022560 [Mycena galopus ATCC 62051]|nr:hypothetical protein K438DRAFT_2022560 [Mycena galopus ATCC 62051]
MLTFEYILIHARNRCEPAHKHQVSTGAGARASSRLVGTHSLKQFPAASPPLLSSIAAGRNANMLGGSVLRGFSTSLLFVGNAAFDATEHDVRDVVAHFGDVESVRWIINPDESFHGLDYVTFTSQTAAGKCLNTRFEIFGRPVRLDYSTPPSHAAGSSALPSNRTVAPPDATGPTPNFSPQTPYGTEEADLREKLTPFGAIIVAEPRGFVHIEFLTPWPRTSACCICSTATCAWTIDEPRTPRGIGCTFTTRGGTRRRCGRC